MNVLPTRDLVRYLVCPMCRGGALEETTTGARCVQCAQGYTTDHGVLTFLVDGELSATNQQEITANTFDDPYWQDKMVNKEEWSPLLSQQMNKVIELVDELVPPGPNLFVLGAGTGYDLQLLLRRRRFDRVFASDIAPGATALIDLV